MEKEHLLLGIGGTLARRLLRLDSLRPGDMVNKHSQLPLAHVKNVCVCALVIWIEVFTCIHGIL